jgi:hypothetical protein
MTMSQGGKTEYLSFADVKQKLADHLRIALNLTEFDIVFAKREKELALDKTGREIWRVNLEFKEGDLDKTAQISLDAVTGEIIQFQKSGYWASRRT